MQISREEFFERLDEMEIEQIGDDGRKYFVVFAAEADLFGIVDE